MEKRAHPTLYVFFLSVSPVSSKTDPYIADAPRMSKTLPNCPFFHDFIVFEFTKCYGGHLIVKLIVCMINTFKSKCNNQ